LLVYFTYVQLFAFYAVYRYFVSFFSLLQIIQVIHWLDSLYCVHSACCYQHATPRAVN